MCNSEYFIGWIKLPETVESIFFFIGVGLGFILERWGYEEQYDPNTPTDWTKRHTYFWLIGPIGFVVAAATIYKKDHIYNHWLFGNEKAMSFLIYATDFFSGMVAGILVFLIITTLIKQITAIHGNISNERKQRSVTKDEVKTEEVTFEQSIEQSVQEPAQETPTETTILPTAWDRFTAERQISYLESFLARMDNSTDRQALQFWKERQSDIEENGFTFRLAFLEEALSKLNLRTIPERDYLSIEFWKTKGGAFRIRTTSGSEDKIKAYSDVTPEQREELEPYISFWYKKFK